MLQARVFHPEPCLCRAFEQWARWLRCACWVVFVPVGRIVAWLWRSGGRWRGGREAGAILRMRLLRLGEVCHQLLWLVIPFTLPMHKPGVRGAEPPLWGNPLPPCVAGSCCSIPPSAGAPGLHHHLPSILIMASMFCLLAMYMLADYSDPVSCTLYPVPPSLLPLFPVSILVMSCLFMFSICLHIL